MVLRWWQHGSRFIVWRSARLIERARREFHHRDTEDTKLGKGREIGTSDVGTRLTVFPRCRIGHGSPFAGLLIEHEHDDEHETID